MKLRTPIGCLLLAGALLAGCTAGQKVGDNGNSTRESSSGVKLTNPSMTLADYLQQVPGVQVQQSGGGISVNIRGSQSVNTSNEPLFVVDGQRVGRSYNTVVNIVSVSNIAYVDVLKGPEGKMRYGMEGSSGVIRIVTKRTN